MKRRSALRRIAKNPGLRKRICIDARPLIYSSNGNARYLSKMLANLIPSRPDYEWILLAHRPIHRDHGHLFAYDNVTMGGASPLPGPLWLNLKLPSLLRSMRCDLFWGSLSLLPLFYKRRVGIPAVVNFHDLNAFVAGDTMVFWNRMQHRMLDGHSLANADLIFCLSETTRRDILRFFPGCEDRLRVVYPGTDRLSKKSRRPALPPDIKNFILSVGTIEPRKNHSTLIEAYRAARAQYPLLPLLIVGRRGWGMDELYESLRSGVHEKEGIYYLENAGEEELSWCYQKCAFLVLPSLHEGFGLPLIEALDQGKSCILSDIPIFREIGEGMRFISPKDRDGWRDALIEYTDLYKKRRLHPPAFDATYWSWSRRAEFLGKILDEILPG
jgi:glycosyltransferase involved in cell wall biosynthesis